VTGPPGIPPHERARLVALLDRLEGESTAYLDLDRLRAAWDGAPAILDAAIAEDVLLVDDRTRLDEATGALVPITLCRLNRSHPDVRQQSL
jgi:hypothetical protein